jgi:hypothetical protein
MLAPKSPNDLALSRGGRARACLCFFATQGGAAPAGCSGLLEGSTSVSPAAPPGPALLQHPRATPPLIGAIAQHAPAEPPYQPFRTTVANPDASNLRTAARHPVTGHLAVTCRRALGGGNG